MLGLGLVAGAGVVAVEVEGARVGADVAGRARLDALSDIELVVAVRVVVDVLDAHGWLLVGVFRGELDIQKEVGGSRLI